MSLLIFTNIITFVAFLWKRDQWCALMNEKAQRDLDAGRPATLYV